jgi:hypothetical protein
MKVIRTATLILAALAGVALWQLSAVGQQDTPPAKQAGKPAAVDIGQWVSKELMSMRMEGDQMELALWFPFEFFIESNREPGVDRAAIEKELAVLKPYIIVITQSGYDRPDGLTDYMPEPQARARATLVGNDGEKVRPLEKVPPMVAAMANAMKTMMAAEGDAGSRNLHVMFFANKTAEGKLLIDPAKRQKLTLVMVARGRFKAVSHVWRTPFDALNRAPDCGKCGEPVSAKWLFCPWCGNRLAPEPEDPKVQPKQ